MRKETSESASSFPFKCKQHKRQELAVGKDYSSKIVVVKELRCDATMLIRTRVSSAAAMLLLLAGVQAQHRVTLSSKSLCAVTGSTIQIPCTFTKPYYSVTQREWYRVQSSEGEPQDLSTDPQYSGRVSVNMWGSDCELTVWNVRVSDSGVYNFRFKTQRNDWISASSGVNLTVTGNNTYICHTYMFKYMNKPHLVYVFPDLKVIVSDSVWGKKLSCITTCTRSNKVYWYENEQRVPNQNKNYLFVYVYGWERDSYSCGVTEDENFRSTAVCAGCWSVTYSTQTICSLIGSSVDMHSYYTFPHYQKVTNVLWFIKDQADGEPVDITEEEEYQGRVQYTRSSQNNCGLKITNLTERDAQTYKFRFYTDDPKGRYTGEPGVSLSVTGNVEHVILSIRMLYISTENQTMRSFCRFESYSIRREQLGKKAEM
ncbi:uncharacterized protein Hap1MRO34_003566 isoform 1-T2 [Clarias gariepinus]